MIASRRFSTVRSLVPINGVIVQPVGYLVASYDSQANRGPHIFYPGTRSEGDVNVFFKLLHVWYRRNYRPLQGTWMECEIQSSPNGLLIPWWVAELIHLKHYAWILCYARFAINRRSCQQLLFNLPHLNLPTTRDTLQNAIHHFLILYISFI
jgi:hypothetical protein